MIHKFILGSIAACMATAFAAEGWLTDLDAGKKQAAAENKAVLAEFTGSDWCHYCVELRKNVFSKPDFKDYASKDFVLVELDYPRANTQSPEEKKKNEAWSKQYGVNGFPTILVLDADGAAYGGFVGGRPDLASVKEPLNQALKTMKEVKETLAAAAKMSGDDQIKALAKAYKAIPEEYRASHADLLKQIMDLDKNDISGIVAAEKKAAEEKALNEKIAADLASCKTPQEALAKTEEYLAQKNLPEDTQLNLLQQKLMILLKAATDDESFNKALSFLDEIAKIDTEHKTQIDEFKANLNKNKANIIERNKNRGQAPQ